MAKPKNNKIAIIQPFIAHFREQFFNDLQTHVDYDLYSFQKIVAKHREGLKAANIKYKKLKILHIKQFRLFNPFRILFHYDTIVLCGEISIISNWVILLMNKVFLNRKILVWGHGATYSKKNPINFGHILMYCLSDGGIFYTSKEMRFWRRKFPKKQMTFLNNTIYIDQTYISALNENKSENLKKLKTKYKIYQKELFISCHRFSNPNRRHDLLLQAVLKSNPNNVGFIIIGEGSLKPDFSDFSNVYDFGAVWDSQIKTELFFIANYYLQFGWTGLSIVEAFAFGKPVITMKRDSKTRHSVEYNYLKNGYNSIILNDINQLNNLNLNQYDNEKLSLNALHTYNNDLRINHMVNKMFKSITNE